MYHIHIIHAKADWFAAVMLRGRLRRHYRRHSYGVPVVIHPDLRQLSDDPEDRNYLIVLCSTDTAEHPQIEADIRRFHEKEPLTHIIPYVAGGQPNAKDPKNECLPRILMELSSNDLLAVNPLQLGRQIALHKVISTINGISVEELEQRGRKERLRYRSIACLLTACVLLYVLWNEYSTRAHTEYYRSYTYAYGVPVGRERLGYVERLFCEDYYIFRVHYTEPVSIERVGDPPRVETEDPDARAYYDAIDTPMVQFCYHMDGALDAAVHADAEGTILFVIHYLAGGTAADFSCQPDGIEPYYLMPEGQEAAYSRCMYEYDGEGNLSAVRYLLNSRDGADGSGVGD